MRNRNCHSGHSKESFCQYIKRNEGLRFSYTRVFNVGVLLNKNVITPIPESNVKYLYGGGRECPPPVLYGNFLSRT